MRIVLAYSGSLAGSAAIPWLRDHHDAEVVSVTVDLGQARTLEPIRDRARALGAQRAHVIDARDRFAERYVVPALKAGALCRNAAPIRQTLSLPAIALELVQIARIERADAVAHTAGDERALDGVLGSLAPSTPVITPVRSWSLSHDDLHGFAHAHGIPAVPDDHAVSGFWGPQTHRKPNTSDHRALRPTATASSGHVPDDPAIVEVSFDQGVPTSLNGVAMPLVELIQGVGTLADRHGIGHIDIEHGGCEAPAIVLLHTAHLELTRAALTSDFTPLEASISEAYGGIIDTGRWFTPLRDALDAYLAVAQRRVTGRVRMRLLKGTCTTVATHVAEPPDSRPAAAAPFSVRGR
jgi:argininosuccinate synthase